MFGRESQYGYWSDGSEATMEDNVRMMVSAAGEDHPDRAWILTPFDSWEKNPYYRGAPQRHPEDQSIEAEDVAPAPQVRIVPSRPPSQSAISRLEAWTEYERFGGCRGVDRFWGEYERWANARDRGNNS